MRYLLCLFVLALIQIDSSCLLAQRNRRDTTGTGSVDIVSSFRPILRDPVKLQFTATPPGFDSNRDKLTYRIPSQELSITYQPGTLKPLAYQSDSNRGLTPAQYIKLGYGNLRNPYASIALRFGDKSPVMLYADHRSAKGNMPFQSYSITSGRISWQLPDQSKGEWMAALYGDRQSYNKYGFESSLPTPPVDSIRQVFHQLGLQFAYRRKAPTESGFLVEPSIQINLVGDQIQNRDISTRLWMPVHYAFNDQLSFRLRGLIDWGRISSVGKTSTDVSVYSINPSLRYDRSRWSAQLGIRPSWDAKGIRMYPDVSFQWKNRAKPWFIQAQWSGELMRTGFRELYSVNPWSWFPSEWRNRGEIDRSLRWQYNRRVNWTYHLQAGYATLQDPFLFINDTSISGDGKSFQVVYAERIQNLYATAGLTFRKADRWQMLASVRWNNFHGLKGQAEPWGMLPFEWKINGVYNWPKRVKLTADMYSWFAPYYLTKSGQPSRTDGAFDLNLGAEMPVTKSIRAWLQFNNLLNRSYQRWRQYPVYGFHFVGGVVFSLDKSIP